MRNFNEGEAQEDKPSIRRKNSPEGKNQSLTASGITRRELMACMAVGGSFALATVTFANNLFSSVKSLHDLAVTPKGGMTVDFFRSLPTLAIDEGNIDLVDYKIKSYRNSGVRTLRDMVLKPAQKVRVEQGLLLANADTNLFSVGGPKSSPSTLVSLGYDVDERLSSQHRLFYSYDLEVKENQILENYGDGNVLVPNFTINSRSRPEKAYAPSLVFDKGLNVYRLQTDVCMLTVCPNPFNHTYRHYVFSSCHGIGCKVLPQLLGIQRFQAEAGLPDNFQKDYFQVLVEIDVTWSGRGYEWLEPSFRVLEVLDRAGPRRMKSTDEAMAAYTRLLKERLV